MAYNKHVWSAGETITSALLNNIEDEVDAIADLAYTFAGQKKFTTDPIVEKSDAGIHLDDTDGGGKYFILRSKSGKMEIYDEDAVGIALADIITHQHGGTIDGLAVDYPDLTNRTHGPGDHTDRTHTKFVPGMAFWAQYQYAMVTGGSPTLTTVGPELRYTTDDTSVSTLRITSGELYKLSNTRPAYAHLRNVGSVTGNAVLDVQVQGVDDGDVNGTILGSFADVIAGFSGTKQYQRVSLGNVDLSTGVDMIAVTVTRLGSHGSDTLDESIILCGFEIIAESDQ